MTATATLSHSSRFWLYRILIVAFVLAAIYRLCGAEFSYWDDQGTIHQNPRINNPTIESVVFYWKHFKDGLYVPVTYTLWAALAKMAFVNDPGDKAIFLNPWFFHTTNVLLHLISSVLVFEILRLLLKRLDGALIGALFFGLHPVQVEAVGWVSGMKDVLCWTFTLATVWIYIRRVETVQATGKPLWASYEMPLCTLLLILGILSKPTAMVTPAALLMIDGLLLRKRWIRSGVEFLPLFMISGVGAVIARLAQYTHTITVAPIWQRPFIVGDNIVFYFGKILWPAQLCIDYARTVDYLQSSPLLYVKWLIPAALFVFAFYYRHRWPVIAAGLAVFVIGFAPVSGLATFQMQQISFTTDHYLYFSMFGIALIAAWLTTLLPRKVAYPLASVVLLALAVRMHMQTGLWQTNETLFAGTIKANPNSPIARNNLAAMHLAGLYPRYDLAEPLLEEATRIRPQLAHAWANLGRTKAALGKNDEAMESLNRAWQAMKRSSPGGPELADLASDIAVQYEWMGKIDEALAWAQTSEELFPNDHMTRQIIGRLKLKAATRPSTRPAADSTAPTTRPAPADGSASGR